MQKVFYPQNCRDFLYAGELAVEVLELAENFALSIDKVYSYEL
jgi:hypothetical protein